MNTHTTPLLEWQAPARPDPVRSERWYVVTGLLCATFIAYGILTRAWALSVSLGMLAGLFFLVRNQKHPLRRIRILETGIEVDGRMRIWAEWENFWILQGDGYYELRMAPKKHASSELIVLTGDIDPYLIRDVLSEFVPQIAHQKERLLDAIIRYCKL